MMLDNLTDVVMGMVDRTDVMELTPLDLMWCLARAVIKESNGRYGMDLMVNIQTSPETIIMTILDPGTLEWAKVRATARFTIDHMTPIWMSQVEPIIRGLAKVRDTK